MQLPHGIEWTWFLNMKIGAIQANEAMLPYYTLLKQVFQFYLAKNKHQHNTTIKQNNLYMLMDRSSLYQSLLIFCRFFGSSAPSLPLCPLFCILSETTIPTGDGVGTRPPVCDWTVAWTVACDSVSRSDPRDKKDTRDGGTSRKAAT